MVVIAEKVTDGPLHAVLPRFFATDRRETAASVRMNGYFLRMADEMKKYAASINKSAAVRLRSYEARFAVCGDLTGGLSVAVYVLARFSGGGTYGSQYHLRREIVTEWEDGYPKDVRIRDFQSP